MQDLMTINVVIGDRTYRIKIEPSDEEVVRKTLKAINDKIVEYKTQFAGRDMQDYIAMVLLWYATQAMPGSRGGSDTPFLEALSRIEQQLDKAL
ncbi:MAG TPA: cell division protein ZapA [Puia sp.]|nr:cell division protein ZapA [Puia sp.]